MIKNAADTPLNLQPQGTVPDVSGALFDWLQPVTFMLVTKSVANFQSVEVGESFSFQGVWQPFKPRDLRLVPEGERSWNWFWCHSLTALPINTDDVVNYQGTQYRVMGRNDCGLYGYFEYQLVQDWTGSGPTEE